MSFFRKVDLLVNHLLNDGDVVLPYKKTGTLISSDYTKILFDKNHDLEKKVFLKSVPE